MPDLIGPSLPVQPFEIVARVLGSWQDHRLEVVERLHLLDKMDVDTFQCLQGVEIREIGYVRNADNGDHRQIRVRRAHRARSTVGEIPVGGTEHKKTPPVRAAVGVFGGADGDRTHDLSIANAALSQLSYGPTRRGILH